MPDITVTSGRDCGGCTACCKTPDIDDPQLKKPLGEWCAHCSVGTGCTIYEKRPAACRDFKCQWLIGMCAEDERPDKVGVILDFVPEGKGAEWNTVQFFEVDEGSLTSDFVKKWKDLALKSDFLVLFRFLSGSVVPFVPNRLRARVRKAVRNSRPAK